ncbi:MAG: hypothetical protein JXR10_16080 [Cyclobacteriaceae bacterium]
MSLECKIYFRRLLLLLFLSISIVSKIQAQHLSVNAPILKETLRRSQLIGLFDQQISFSARPVNFISDSAISYATTVWSNSKNSVWLNAMPIQLSHELNTHHPYSNYNAGMLPSRGNQILISSGLIGKIGLVKFRFEPELLFSENKAYNGFPVLPKEDERVWPNSNRWRYMYRWWNNIDRPESFGSTSIRRIIPGQSSILINLEPFALGFSTENLWWGPGKYNSLIMTNNGEGIPHFTFNTVKPVKTRFGSFEAELIYGKLRNSGLYPPDTSKADSKGIKFYVPKFDEKRIFNGISFSYQPKWVNGLFLGINSSIQQYQSTAKHYQDYLPLLTDRFGFGKHRRDTIVRNQMTSVFLRWFDKRHEFYFEYGRHNTSWNWSKIISSPQLNAAFVVGYTNLIPLKKPQAYLEFNIEVTQLQQPPDYMVSLRSTQPVSWYTSQSIRQGYTHNGQIIGNHAGPGSNIQLAEISWVKNFNKIGLYLERLSNNNDFVYQAFYGSLGGDFRSYWIDYTCGILVNKRIKKILISSSLRFTRSLNYQWETVTSSPYFEDNSGVDTNNFNLQTKVVYLF